MVLATFALGIPASAAALIRSSGASERVRALATSAIQEELGLRATLGAVQIELVPFGIVAHDIALDDAIYGRLADAESLVIRPSLASLVRGRLDIASIELQRASVNLVFRDGSIRNLPSIEPGEGGDGPTLPFRRFVVTDSVLSIDGDPHFTGELRGVNGEVTGQADHVIALHATASTGFVQHGETRDELTRLDATVEIGPHELHVADASVGLGSLLASVHEGRLPLPPPTDVQRLEGISGEISVEYDLADLASLGLPITLPRMQGLAHVRASIVDDPERGQSATGTVHVEGGRIEQFGLGDRVHLVFDATSREVHVTDGLVTIQGEGGGTIGLTATLGLTPDFPVSTRATLHGLSFAHLMDQFEVSSDSLVEWIFDGTLDLEGSLARLDLEGPVDLRTHDFFVSTSGYTQRPLRTVLEIPRGHFGGRWSIRDDAVRFSSLVGDLPNSRIFGDVLLGFHNALRVDARAEANLADVSPLAGFAFAGSGPATFRIDGTFQDPLVTGHVELAGFEFDGFRLGDVESDAVLDRDGMGVTFPHLTAVKRDSRYAVNDLYLDFHHDRFELQGDVHLDRMTLADFYHVFHFEEDERFTSYQGIARGDIRVHYTNGFPEDSRTGTLVTDMALDFETALVSGYAFDGGSLAGQWRWLDWSDGLRGGQLRIDHLELAKGEGSLTVTGDMALGGSLHMFASVDRLALRDLEGIGDRLPGLEGIVSATADIGGTAETMRVDMDASLTNVVYAGRTIGDARTYVRLTHQGDPWVTDALAWRAPDPERDVLMSDGGASALPPEDEPCALARAGLARADWRPDPPIHTVDGMVQRLARPSAFLVCGTGLDGRLSIDLAIGRTEQLPLRGRIALDDFDITPFLPSGESEELAAATGRTGGRFSAEVSLTGGGIRDLDELSGRVLVPSIELRRGDLEIRNTVPIDVRLSHGVAHVVRARLRGPGSRLRVRGDASVRSGLGLEVDGDVDLSVLPRVTTTLDEASGQASVRVTLSGPLTDPEYYGEARIEGASLRLHGTATPIDELNLRATFSQRRMLLDEMTAHIAGGTVSVSGEGTIDGRTLSRYELAIEARDLSLRPSDGLAVALGADATLSWAAGQPLPLLAGEIEVDRLEYTHTIEIGTTLSEMTRTERAVVTSYDPESDHVALDLRVVHQEPFLVRNNLVDATISIADDDRPFRIVGTDQRYGVVGDMRFSRGRIFFRNGSFEMRPGGVLTFDDEARVDAHFDVHAVTDVRRSGDLTAPSWRVLLDASGSADEFSIVTHSDPDLPQEDILLLLTIGMTRSEAEALRGGDIGGTVALEALATVTGVDREVRRALPVIDDFRLTSAYSVRTGRTEPQVSIGKRIADRVRLSATTGLSESREFRAQVEAQLSETTSVQAGYDNYNLTSASSFGNVGVDLRFRLEFE